MNLHPDRRLVLRMLAAVPALPFLRRTGAWLPNGDDRCLVIVELAGGNDALNCLIPVDDAHYAKARPKLSAVRKGALPVAPGFALHGALRGLHAQFQGGRAAAVHAVGYEQPDRSHFRSRDIWHAADPTLVRVQAQTEGWLGRAAAVLAAAGAGLPAAAIGGRVVPLALHSQRVAVPALRDWTDYQLQAGGGAQEAARRQAVVDLLPPSDGEGPLAFAAATARHAAATAERLRQALSRYAPKAEYPGHELGRNLQQVAQMATSGFGTRLFHVEFGGFDTHAQQLPAQAALLQQLGDALAAFIDDLAAHGALERTRVLVHSEFGRRVAENASLGTDHGAAAAAFVLGGGLKPGLHGTAPDLGDLLDGDVKPLVDFRRVYAELLQGSGIDPAAVLGAALPPVGFSA